MEHLDRGYAPMEWMQDFPHTHIRNLPIVYSDHGPILLQTIPPCRSARRLYQIENWSLRFDEVRLMVHEIWTIYMVGSLAYVLTCRLEILRKRLKAWCLDNKLFWGVNWKRIFEQLYYQGTQITTPEKGVDYTRNHNLVINEAALAITYRKQRM